MGGGVVAVLALVIAFVLYRGAKPQGGNIPDADNSADRLENSDSGKTRAAKVALSAEELFAQASPGVVTITCKNDLGEIIGSGSGFFVKDELVHDPGKESLRSTARHAIGKPAHAAYVLTNYHVIHAAVHVDVAIRGGSETFVYFGVATDDEAADLALLPVIIVSADSPTRLQLAENTPDVGAQVYAIGSPQGLANSLSAGIVSGFPEIKPGVTWLQTTAPISPGSSGGPLLTPAGEVVGLTTASRRDGQNLNFAIPVSELRRFLDAPYRNRKLWEGRSYREQENDAFDQMEFVHLTKHGQSLRQLPDDDPVKMLLKARSQIGEEKYEDAIHTLSRAMPQIPSEFSYLSHFVLAKAQFWLAKKLVERGRTVEETYRNFRNNEHADLALQSVKEGARLNSKFAPTYALLADYHYRAGEWAEGLVAADSLVKLMPQCAKAFYKRAEFFVKLHRGKSALEDLYVSLKLNPRDAEVHLEIGDAWLDLDEYEKSIDSYKTGLSMKPFDPGYYHLRIANAYRKAGKFQQAILAYEKARSLGVDAELCDEGISICLQMMR